MKRQPFLITALICSNNLFFALALNTEMNWHLPLERAVFLHLPVVGIYVLEQKTHLLSVICRAPFCDLS